MKLYRFSPIQTKSQLLKAIVHTHVQSYLLCKQSFGKILPNAGNIGIFSHYENEYAFLTSLRKQLCYSSQNPATKYFELKKQIIIKKIGMIPKTTYTHLYIRKPDPYRSQVGDVDFYIPQKEYDTLKAKISQGLLIPGARIFDRKDLDMIELYDPHVDVLAYLSTDMMSETVRVRQTQ